MALHLIQGAQAYSETVEDIVRRFLNENGIEFLDQAAQQDLHGRGVLTPDFLLTSPVRINGKVVHWIEVKTFYAAGSITSKKVPLGKIPAKMKKYFEQYGFGAVFHWY